MQVFRDAAGRLDVGPIPRGATVQGLLTALDAFLARHPLGCAACADSCCRKGWAVGADNVFARRMAGAHWARFADESLTLTENPALGFDQYVLRKEGPCPWVRPDNACAVYPGRPLICRLYLCGEKSRRYAALREAVAAAFLEALVLERAGAGQALPGNPALYAENYDVPLADVVAYALDQGWMAPEDYRALMG